MARWSWGWVEGAAPMRGQMVAAVAAAAVAAAAVPADLEPWRRCGKGSSRYSGGEHWLCGGGGVVATEAKTAKSAAMAAVMAAAAVLSVAEVMALMIAMAAARLRKERRKSAAATAVQVLSKQRQLAAALGRPCVD
jgi:hypothetical protein